MPVGHVSSRATQLTVRRTRIHSRFLALSGGSEHVPNTFEHAGAASRVSFADSDRRAFSMVDLYHALLVHI